MKTSLALLLFMFFFQINNAQKAELKISSGYHFSSGSQYFISDIDNSYNDFSSKKIDASLGRGLAIAAGINYFFNSWVGISMDIAYKKTMPPVSGKTEFNSFTDYSYSEENKWNSELMQVAPTLILKIPGKKINPFSKFGFVVPFYSKIEVTGNYSSRSFGIQTNTGENTKIFHLKNTIGYIASMGIAPELKNKKFSFLAEIQLLSHSIQAKKSTLTSDISNGVETIDNYTIAAKETIYVKELRNQSYNSNEPTKQLGFSLPYSSIGLNIGLSIKL
jgi:hypothetical protein